MINIQSITAMPTKTTLKVGESSFITVRHSPSNAILPEMHLGSNHPDIVTIDEYGTEILAKRRGTALIYCIILDGSARASACEITVISSSDN